MPTLETSDRTIWLELPGGAYVRHATTTKPEALKAACPKCNAAPGERCTEEDGVTWRPKMHVDRHTAAIAAGARVRFIGGIRVYYHDDVSPPVMFPDRAA